MQRAGVLELVQQNVAIAGIELVLQIIGLFAVAQQAGALPFYVGKIQQRAFVFDCLVVVQEGLAAKQAVGVEMVESSGL